MEEKIRQFMSKQFLFDFEGKINEHSNLFTLGLIDSFGFIELVTFLESEFCIKFSDEDLVDGSLNTLANIVSAVRRKLDGH